MKSNQQTTFRRYKGGAGWCIPDGDHAYFSGSFKTGLARSVRFVHEAPPMACVSGYESTGEAVGVLEETDSAVTMPPDVTVSLEVAYDPRRRRFHVVGEPDNVVEGADYLVLEANGKSTAGWVREIAMVRRHKGGHGWRVSDAGHLHFAREFQTGLMRDVKFVHRAPAMFCVAGYESTGEAIGALERRDNSPSMPTAAVRCVPVVYDSGKRVFHVAGEPREVVDSADFLLLTADGKAMAGWVRSSSRLPGWLKKFSIFG
jgi:hypothetical protein